MLNQPKARKTANLEPVKRHFHPKINQKSQFWSEDQSEREKIINVKHIK